MEKDYYYFATKSFLDYVFGKSEKYVYTEEELTNIWGDYETYLEEFEEDFDNRLPWI